MGPRGTEVTLRRFQGGAESIQHHRTHKSGSGLLKTPKVESVGRTFFPMGLLLIMIGLFDLSLPRVIPTVGSCSILNNPACIFHTCNSTVNFLLSKL